LPTIQSAKDIAENALRTIGAFPSTRPSPDPGEMKTALRWLEMFLNMKAAVRPIGGFWQIFDIPIEAGVGDYDLDDYSEERGVNNIFTVCLVDDLGNVDPMTQQTESVTVGENLQQTGTPTRWSITTDRENVLRVFPEPTQTDEDAGKKLRVRVQTYHDKIDPLSSGDVELRLRASWYLWATVGLAYLIGGGPVRRLAEAELKRHADDRDAYEGALLARDAQFNGRPPVTEPMECSVDEYDGSDYTRGYSKR